MNPRVYALAMCCFLSSFLGAQEESNTQESIEKAGRFLIGVDYNPIGLVINSEELYYDPFSEYGRYYEESFDLKLNLGYEVIPRLYSGVVVIYEEQSFSSYSRNPFLGIEENEFVSSEGWVVQTGVGIGVSLRYNFIDKNKFRLFIKGQSSFHKALKNISNITTTYSNQVISQPESQHDIEDVNYKRQELGVGGEVNVFSSFYLSGELRMTFGQIHPPFSSDFDNGGPFLIHRKELRPTVGIKWYI